MDPRLYHASLTGNVEQLLKLIQEDQLMLQKALLATSDTPLHIAALLGHVEFARELMQRCPEFATALNQQGLAPIHIVVGKGHSTMLSDMLAHDLRLAFMEDSNGKYPLHTAAIKGRANLLEALFFRDSATHLTMEGETVLHLVVKHSQYQSLKVLIELAKERRIGNELFNTKDEDGNTILHLACIGRKSNMVELILSETDIDASVINSKGLTAFDLAARSMADCDMEGNTVTNPTKEVSRYSNVEELLNSLQNIIGIIAGLIGSVCFNSAMNPPGGVWSDWPSGNCSSSINTSIANVTKTYSHSPGKSINWEGYEGPFRVFSFCNSLSFFVSMFIVIFCGAARVNNQGHIKHVIAVLFYCLMMSASLTFVTGMALVTNRIFATTLCSVAFAVMLILILVALVCGWVDSKLHKERKNNQNKSRREE